MFMKARLLSTLLEQEAQSQISSQIRISTQRFSVTALYNG